MTERDSRLTRNRSGADANFPAPPAKSAVPEWHPHADDEPTIGLLLCKTKNNVVAEYALRGYTVPIGVAEWKTAITASLPAELESSLPTVEELEAELADESDILAQGGQDE
jgi:YhcG PDDEXK nuclease domain